MKTRNLSSQITGFILGFTILLCVGIGASITGYAQDRRSDQYGRDRNLDQYGNYGGSVELRQAALNAGYDQGFRQGNYDRQNGGQKSNYRNSEVYRRATQDYRSRLGDRELYRRYFREAFDRGYNSYGNQSNPVRDDRYQYPNRGNNNTQGRRGRNWDGYGNFGGSAELRQTALNAGYNEGNKQGQKNRNGRNNYGFQGQAAYQKATKDYSSRLGDRSLYQRYFREAYENGYSDGVNGY